MPVDAVGSEDVSFVAVTEAVREVSSDEALADCDSSDFEVDD